MAKKEIHNKTGTSTEKTDLFRRFKAAVDTLTIESNSKSSSERIAAIEFLSGGKSSSDILMIFSGILRRFRAHLTHQEKVKIAEVIEKHSKAPSHLRESVSSTLMKAMDIETTPSVRNAYRSAVTALIFDDDDVM